MLKALDMPVERRLDEFQPTHLEIGDKVEVIDVQYNGTWTHDWAAQALRIGQEATVTDVPAFLSDPKIAGIKFSDGVTKTVYWGRLRKVIYEA